MKSVGHDPTNRKYIDVFLAFLIRSGADYLCLTEAVVFGWLGTNLFSRRNATAPKWELKMPELKISTIDPDRCRDMHDLRTEIDILDYQIIKLLVHRAKYIDRAVTLKQIEGLPARTHDRVAAVLSKVRDQCHARRH